MKNRSLSLILLAGAALTVTACVGPNANLDELPGRSPLSRYVLQVEPDQDRIALAVHQNAELSGNQRHALASLAARYRAENNSALVIEVPAGNDPTTLRAAGNVRAALEGMGVSAQQISLVSYASSDPLAPVLAGYSTVQAVVPRCGEVWGNLARTGENAGSSNFGCAVNANLAAQISDPRDIVSPRASTPLNAQRRTVVYEAYRQGQVSSAQRDPMLATARVSEAIN